MKPYRLFGLVILAVLAMCAVAASAASAAAPEFKGTGKFTSSSGTGKLENTSGTKIECASGASNGEITGVTTVGKVVVTFKSCTAEGGKCTAKSPGAGADNEIVTHTLKGTLGTTKEATNGVGVLFVPETGKAFVTIESSCTLISPAEVTGSLAGEATPTLKSSTTGKLVFTGSKGVAHIKTIAVGGKSEKAKLEAFGFESSQETTENVTYVNSVEVT
jgi:hypothetical protein